MYLQGLQGKGWVRRRSVLRRQVQDLAGADLVGVVELVAVGFENRMPAAGLAVVVLGNRRKRVAALQGVGLASAGRNGIGVSLHVREFRAAARGRHRIGMPLDIGKVRAARAAAAGLQRQLVVFWILR